MMFDSMRPASPPTAGRAGLLDTQIAGVSAARISSKSPSDLTLFGANSVMSTSPDQSSRCLMSSQLRDSADEELLRAPGKRPLVRTSTQDPFSLYPLSVNLRSPFLSAA